MFENTHLYSLKEMHRAGLAPIRMMAHATKHLFNNPLHPMSYTGLGRHMAAAGELIERITQSYPKPEFGIDSVVIEDMEVAVTEEVAMEKSFCHLRRFTCNTENPREKLLLVAPMSGHHATLLRGTVQALVAHHDVYITDWVDAREVSLSKGAFNLNTYIDYLIEFMQFLGPSCHAMAVCQPSVPLYAAVAIMNTDNDKATPLTMTLMGGPIDTREAPTTVNQFAKDNPMQWFESNVITRVPMNYPGFMRRVYPGFLQLTGFMSMNMERHVGEHMKLFEHLVEGDGESANAHRKFYNEYLSVADLPAEFYLQTIDAVFHEHALPRGNLTHHERRVNPEAITKTAILAVEGELDDISGLGQTKAALTISAGLPKAKKKYHMQKSVGHYGIFNGRKWREHVRPVITDWIRKHNK